MNRIGPVLILAAALAAAGCSTESDTQAPASTSAARDEAAPIFGEEWKTDFAKHSVPLSGFVSGGPGKDGIPAIDEPQFETVEEASTWIEDKEPVIQLELDGEARASPSSSS